MLSRNSCSERDDLRSSFPMSFSQSSTTSLCERMFAGSSMVLMVYAAISSSSTKIAKQTSCRVTYIQLVGVPRALLQQSYVPTRSRRISVVVLVRFITQPRHPI
ncbi:hypothetical protein HanIR_Chr03g0136501 [Helianthus annuus]|nr:hypothetical protein HanIR_Chr03g0136501 [Helianthus annuus]